MNARSGVHAGSRRCLAAPILLGLPVDRSPISRLAPVARIGIRAAAFTRTATDDPIGRKPTLINRPERRNRESDKSGSDEAADTTACIQGFGKVAELVPRRFGDAGWDRHRCVYEQRPNRCRSAMERIWSRSSALHTRAARGVGLT